MAAVAAVLALAAACGGSSTSLADAEATAGIPAGSTVIDQRDLAFKPGAVTVQAGQTVYFLNSETALHTATIDGKDESGNMKKGAVFAWKAPAAGTYKVTCKYHAQMHATITVNAAPTQ
ncbi:MAG: cupredoxin domain-containing protein [Tepidiformaceae bacterium]